MATQWWRRAGLAAATAAALALAACGGGDVVSQLKPNRIVAFGDAFSDSGQRGARYTVNDNTVNTWTLQVASSYGVPLTNANVGGTAYATGSARINSKPDAAGDASTPTVKEQIDTFLASRAFDAKDLVLLGAGTADVIAEAQRVISGAQTQAQAQAAVRQAGIDLATQVRRLVQAGAKQVVVVGPYNLGRSPWALQTGQASLLQDLSLRFNEELLVTIVDLGSNVLYVDAALYLNLVTATPASYDIGDVNTPACTSVDPGTGIGTGTGQVSSALCNAGTLRPGINLSRTLFADRVYLTPRGAQLFGQYAYDRIHDRF